MVTLQPQPQQAPVLYWKALLLTRGLALLLLLLPPLLWLLLLRLPYCCCC